MEKTQKDTEEGVSNVVPFERLATQPQPPGGPDWLRTLPPDCRFLAQKKNSSGYLLEWFGIGQILPKAILLAHEGQMGGMAFSWVKSEKFCQTYDFHSMLPQPVEEQDDKNEHHLPQPASGGDNEHEPGAH